MLEWIKTNKLAKVTRWVLDSEVDDGNDGYEFTEDLNQADIVTSIRKHGMAALEAKHSLVLDIDVPCELVRSSNGNGHLFIDARCTWEQYDNLLEALVQCGVLQTGYVDASRARGFTAVRLPWKHKRDAIIQKLADSIKIEPELDATDPF